MRLIPFPKCPHKDRPQKYEETSYEYFESACEECYRAWQKECRTAQMQVWIEKGGILQWNESGNYTVWLKGEPHPLNPKGMWMQGAITPTEKIEWDTLRGVRDA